MVNYGGLLSVLVKHIETVPIDYRRFSNSLVADDYDFDRIRLDFIIGTIRSLFGCLSLLRRLNFVIKVLFFQRPFWYSWRTINCLNDSVALKALFGVGHSVLGVRYGLNTLFKLELLFIALVYQTLHRTLFLVT